MGLLIKTKEDWYASIEDMEKSTPPREKDKDFLEFPRSHPVFDRPIQTIDELQQRNVGEKYIVYGKLREFCRGLYFQKAEEDEEIVSDICQKIINILEEKNNSGVCEGEFTCSSLLFGSDIQVKFFSDTKRRTGAFVTYSYDFDFQSANPLIFDIKYNAGEGKGHRNYLRQTIRPVLSRLYYEMHAKKYRITEEMVVSYFYKQEATNNKLYNELCEIITQYIDIQNFFILEKEDVEFLDKVINVYRKHYWNGHYSIPKWDLKNIFKILIYSEFCNKIQKLIENIGKKDLEAFSESFKTKVIEISNIRKGIKKILNVMMDYEEERFVKTVDYIWKENHDVEIKYRVKT